MTFRRWPPYLLVIEGDSVIPGSRPNGGTPLTITRDCDRPNDKGKRWPTVQMLNETVNQLRRIEGKVTVKPHTTRLVKQQEDQTGIRGETRGGSVTLLGKRGIRRGERGWMWTINTHGVEFSIAGCVGEIINDPNTVPFVFSFFFIF